MTHFRPTNISTVHVKHTAADIQLTFISFLKTNQINDYSTLYRHIYMNIMFRVPKIIYI